MRAHERRDIARARARRWDSCRPVRALADVMSQLKYKADRADLSTKADKMDLTKLTKSLRSSPEMMMSGGVGGGGGGATDHAGLASECAAAGARVPLVTVEPPPRAQPSPCSSSGAASRVNNRCRLCRRRLAASPSIRGA